MKVLDILQTELTEMADAKDPDKIADLIKKGDYEGAAKMTVSKTSGKPLKSVARNVRDLLDPEQVKKYREELSSGNSPASKKGFGKKAADKRTADVVKAAKGDKSGSTSSTSDLKLKKKMITKIRNVAKQTMDDPKLSDEEKKSNLAALQVVGEYLNAAIHGGKVLDKNFEVDDRYVKIARAKLQKENPKALENLKKLEAEEAEEKVEYEELAKNWKKETGKTPEQSIDDAIASGLLRMRADKTVPKTKDEIEDEKIEKESKNKSLKDQILGNSK